MNPLLLLIVILILGQSGANNRSKRRTPYIKGTASPKRLANAPAKARLLPSPGFSSSENVRTASEGSQTAGNSSTSGFIDTFKMELLLDQLRNVTDSLERVNKLNRMRAEPLSRENFIDRMQESLGAVKGFIGENSKSMKKVETLSSTLSGVKRISSMESIISSMGPILSMLGDDTGDAGDNDDSIMGENFLGIPSFASDSSDDAGEITFDGSFDNSFQ